MEYGKERKITLGPLPICGGKTRTKVYEDTVLVNFPLYCPKCKREFKVDLVKLRMVVKQ